MFNKALMAQLPISCSGLAISCAVVYLIPEGK
jgi:hypothetical protein